MGKQNVDGLLGITPAATVAVAVDDNRSAAVPNHSNPLRLELAALQLQTSLVDLHPSRILHTYVYSLC
jgi:hypothetical protein